MKLVQVKKSSNKNKKYVAVFSIDDKEKQVHFGAKGMDDFTITKDEEQRKRYRARHKKDLETNDPTRAGYLSYFILWNKPTIKESIKDYKQRFNL